MKQIFSLLFCGLLSLSSIPSVFAATPEQLQKAAEVFEVAEKNYKVGDYEKELEGYKEAYVLSGEADLLFNLAQCQRKLKRNEEALRTYKTFLAERPDTPVKADVEVIIRDLELEISVAPRPTDKQPPAYFTGEDNFFSVGGGLSLLGIPIPMLSAVSNFGIVEVQARLGGLNFLLGGIDVGVHIITSPRHDKNARSLLNISSGLSTTPVFSSQEVVVDVRQNNTNIIAGLYGANSFYISCKFSVRTELQFGARVFNRTVQDGVVLDNGNQDIDLNLFINAFAHYNLKRDPCLQ